MDVSRLLKLAPHVAIETWESFMLVLEFFVLQHPLPAAPYKLWCLCVPTTKPASPQAFVVIGAQGEIQRFHWTRPSDHSHQHSYWEEWLSRAQQVQNAYAEQQAMLESAAKLAQDLSRAEERTNEGYDLEVTIRVIKKASLPRNSVLRRASSDKGLTLGQVKDHLKDGPQDLFSLELMLDATDGKRQKQLADLVKFGAEHGALVLKKGWVSLP